MFRRYPVFPFRAVFAFLVLLCAFPPQAGAAPKPDIVASRLSLGTSVIRVGGTIPLQLTVTNRGRGPASSVRVAISVTIAGATSPVVTLSLGSLPAGASTTAITTLNAPTLPGTYTVTAAATATSSNSEQNLTNNTTMATLQVAESSTTTASSTATISTASSTPTTSTDSTASSTPTTSVDSSTTTSSSTTSPSSSGTGQSYIENPSVQFVASNGWCNRASPDQFAGPAGGGDKVSFAYMSSDGGCNTGAHRIFVTQYDYLTGLLQTSPALDSIDPICCDGHDAPTILRDPSGYYWVFYGGVSSACDGSAVRGPWYRVSTNADDVNSWHPRTAWSGEGSISEITGGFDANGVLHLFGQHQCGGTIPSFSLTYARRLRDGTWQVVALARVGTPTQGTQGFRGDPGCYPHGYVVPGTTTIYVTFSRAISGCAGNELDRFVIRSTDGGDTWTNAAGSSAFPRTAGLVGVFNSGTGLYEYPTAYRAYQGQTKDGAQAFQLSNGTPSLILTTPSAALFTKYVNGAWTSPSMIQSGTLGVYSAAVTLTGKILVYGTDTNQVLKEYASNDAGASFSSTTLRIPSAETSNRQPGSRWFPNLGGKERVIVQWYQNTGGGTSTNVAVVDRPQ
jgi:hypothetical protein